MNGRLLFVMTKEKINKIKKEMDNYKECPEFVSAIQTAIENINNEEYAFYDEECYSAWKYILYYVYLNIVLNKGQNPCEMLEAMKQAIYNGIVWCYWADDTGMIAFM